MRISDEKLWFYEPLLYNNTGVSAVGAASISFFMAEGARLPGEAR
jgi:hypothetical protein